MKFRYMLLSLVAMTCFGAVVAQAQWTQTNGPWTGNYLPSIFVDGETVLAGTQYGIYRSTDGGDLWEHSYSDTPSGTVISFAANGNVYFAGTTLEGVFRSADLGRSWNPINNGLTDLHVRALEVSPDRRLLYAGTSEGVFRSTDNGTTWKPSSEGLTNLGVRCLLIKGDGQTMYAGTDKGLFRSTNKGDFWVRVDGGVTNYVEALAYTGNIIIAVTLEGVFRSTNGGDWWTQSTMGLPTTNAYDVAVVGATIFIGTPEGVFTSKDGGARWSEVSSGLPDAPVFRVFAIGSTEDGMLFAGTDGGVYRTDLTTLKWHGANTGLPTVSMMTLTAMDDEMFVGTHGWGIYVTADKGTEWRQTNNGLTSRYVRCMASTENSLFAGTAGGVFLSTDRGRSWEELADSGRLAGAQCMATGADFEGRTRIFVGTGQGAFVSTDDGTTWTDCDLGTAYPNINAIVAPKGPGGSSIVFAGTPNGGMYISTNAGDSWDLMNTGLELHNIVSLTTDKFYIYAGTTNGIYRTRLNSTIFEWTHAGLPETIVYSLASIPNGAGGAYLFAGTQSGGMYFSNNGLDWIEVGEGMPASDVLTLAYNEGYLYAGTLARAVWQRPVDEMIALGPPAIPLGLALHQNYPNPYSPVDGAPHTVIDYEVPTTATVSLKVYNMSGQEVATLVEGAESEGIHTAIFDASHLPSGNYIYRLTANGQTVDRLMMVVR